MRRARVTRLAGHFVIKLTTTENRMLDKDRTKPHLVCRHGPVAGRADHERRSVDRRLDRAVRTQTGWTPSGSALSRASADGGMWAGALEYLEYVTYHPLAGGLIAPCELKPEHVGMTTKQFNTGLEQRERSMSDLEQWEKWADEFSGLGYGPFDLEEITLDAGSHSDPSDGHCLLEVVSLFAGELFSDSPRCVCPILAAYGRAWNDRLPDNAAREQLRQYIPRLVGTKSTAAVELRRSMMAADWLIRVYTPKWLDLNPSLAAHAAALRAHPEIINTDGLVSVLPVVVAAKKGSSAPEGAALDVATGTSRSVDLAALGAATDAALYSALDGVRRAVRAVALEAVWAVVKDIISGGVQGGVLSQTVTELQTDAHRLFDKMIRVTEQSPC